MDNIVVITQNVKLESLAMLRQYIKNGSDTLVFSTQLVFENEKAIIEEALNSKCLFKNFSDFLSDKDLEDCDIIAYDDRQRCSGDYYDAIKKIKNEKIVKKILSEYPSCNKIIVCGDLGLDVEVWINHGFVLRLCEYYYQYTYRQSSPIRRLLRPLKLYLLSMADLYYISRRIMKSPIYYAYFKGQKHLFFGSLNRIGYRLSLSFEASSKIKNLQYLILFFCCKFLRYYPKNNVIRLSTLHEAGNWEFPDYKNINLKLIQDGYLPPNYSSKYLLFNGKHVEYYTWDVEGGRTFDYHHLKHRVIPFRNKLYLPKPNYPQKVKKVLCVASGAGDWTAIKNRSDEDKMIQTFGKVAALFPNIEFVYRCHPVWIHPVHQGVNSINRAAEYIHWLNLPNLRISSNIPNANEDGKFRLSYKRSSFEEDLEGVDIVFGEHSISQIDAAFKKILFCSVNVTGRRDFFEGITEMGFPHCESESEICIILKELTTENFKARYDKAIDNYNIMTNKEA